MADKRQPSIGDKAGSTSYPNQSPGSIGGSSTSLGNAAGGNYNVANFVEDPEVLNASPATKKSYSWNRGENGNAT